MIITKEQQEAILDKYMKDHTINECFGFIEGMIEAVRLIQVKDKENNAEESQGFVDGMKSMIELIQNKENDSKNDIH